MIREDVTIAEPQDSGEFEAVDRECCLVQIYPADIIDGMIPMEQDTIVVGRVPQCDLQIEDSSVSRRHAEFRRVNDSYDLCDLGSTNGTFVNGESIKNHELRSGDCIKFGSYLFKYLSAGSIETIYHETVYSTMTIDALTGAFNKSYLLDNLQREIARCHRKGHDLAVVMSDIDKFKSVNDTHGHLVGDEVLKEFGQRLLEISREDDLFARYGGEEFSLVLAESDEDEAMQMAERCREAIAAKPFDTSIGPLSITSSFGVAMMPSDVAVSPTDMIGEADERLYLAKRWGRNQVVGPNSEAPTVNGIKA